MRKRYRYEVRYFRVEDQSFHECTGQVVAVLQSAYNVDRKTWYLTVLVRKDQEIEGLSSGEEVWKS